MIWIVALTFVLTMIFTSGLFMWAAEEIDGSTFTTRMVSYLLIVFLTYQVSGVMT